MLRFGGVGLIATAIHYLVMYSLDWLGLPLFAANTLAFLVAILFSFHSQQRVTFVDRLQGRRLGRRAFALIVFVNACINAMGGLLVSGFGWTAVKILLPLVAAGANFVLYWLATAIATRHGKHRGDGFRPG